MYKNLILYSVIIFYGLFLWPGRGWGKLENYGQIAAAAKKNAYFIKDSSEESLNDSGGEVNITDHLKICDDTSLGFLRLKGLYEKEDFTVALDKAYISYQGKRFSFELGKDRILNGVGYAWNPADILNPSKSPLYRDAERRNEEEGIFLSSFTFFDNIDELFFELKAIGIPKSDLDQEKGVASIKFVWNFLEFCTVAGFQKNREDTYGGYLRTSIPKYEFLTLYSEYQNFNYNKGWKYMFGLQLNPSFEILSGNLQLQTEYFKNKDGYKGHLDKYTFNTPDNTLILAETRSNYLYAGLTYIHLDYFLSIGMIRNLDSDQSGIINYLFAYNLTHESKLSIGGFITTYEDPEREFPAIINKKYEIYFEYSMAFGFSFLE